MTPRQLILGTAGHIDHGKTALVRALSGIDTDRLPQEKQRGITIDIGFAHLDLGELGLGIVDVPGHERFIKNMLAGATGIDVAMLVVAADDSVMPQTREHLAILQLLEVNHGLIALTKVDLAETSWLDLVEQEVRELVAGTFLENAPLVRTSATTGFGVEELKSTLAKVCAGVEEREPQQSFRLAVDRSFVMQGLGTIVTGTVWSGHVATGDDVEWLPPGRTIRVRGLESHGREVDRVDRGQRAAINLMGAHHSEIQRGHEIATPESLRPSRLLTVRLSVLADSPWPIKHRARFRLHLGTQQVMVRVSLLNGTTVPVGELAYAQLMCSEPTMATGGQPFVLRAESPLVTVGGGHVLQPSARRISRRDSRTITQLKHLHDPDPVKRGEVTIYNYCADDWSDLDLCRDANISADRATILIEQLSGAGMLADLAVSPRRTLRLHRDVLADLENRVLEALRELHDASPAAPSIPRSSLARRLHYLNLELLNGIATRLIQMGAVLGDDKTLALADFAPKLTSAQKRVREHVIQSYHSAGLRPPVPAELAKDTDSSEADVGSILNLCVSQGHLIHLSRTLYLDKDWEAILRDRVKQHLSSRAQMTMSELRDLLDTTRKFSVPIGEYLDRIGLTKRVGDVRVLADPTSGKVVR